MLETKDDKNFEAYTRFGPTGRSVRGLFSINLEVIDGPSRVLRPSQHYILCHGEGMLAGPKHPALTHEIDSELLAVREVKWVNSRVMLRVWGDNAQTLKGCIFVSIALRLYGRFTYLPHVASH